MADLIVIAYDTEATAEAARKKLFELQKEYLIELGDAVVAVRQPDGHVKLNQLVSMTAAGAASGGMWGALIGFSVLQSAARSSNRRRSWRPKWAVQRYRHR